MDATNARSAFKARREENADAESTINAGFQSRVHEGNADASINSASRQYE